MEDNNTQRVSGIKEAFLKWSGLFLVLVAFFAIVFIVNNINAIFGALGDFLGLLKPVVYGGVIAYLLNPLMNTYQGALTSLASKRRKNSSGKGKKPSREKQQPSEKAQGLIKGGAITLSLITGILIITVLCWLIIPQIVASITSLVNSLPQTVNHYYAVLEDKIRNNALFEDKLQDTMLVLTQYIEEKVNTELLPWMQKELLPGVNSMATTFANGVISVFNLLYNLFIGIIVAIYVLISKETFAAQAKKLLYGVLKRSQADTVIHYVRVSHGMFSGFIIGKIVDSTIIGFICFACMWVFQMPYAVLVSVIIGVTNIIPFFGPYLGLVPSVLLILLVSPMQALYFIIIIAILQQVDGNIIGPAILGESTGLSAFWVLFSILLFGSLWGVFGMIIGVPLFAVIYQMVKDFVEWCLRGKNLKEETDSYRNLKGIEADGNGGVSYVSFDPEEAEAKKEEKRRKRQQLKKNISAFAAARRKKK